MFILGTGASAPVTRAQSICMLACIRLFFIYVLLFCWLALGVASRGRTWAAGDADCDAAARARVEGSGAGIDAGRYVGC